MLPSPERAVKGMRVGNKASRKEKAQIEQERREKVQDALARRNAAAAKARSGDPLPVVRPMSAEDDVKVVTTYDKLKTRKFTGLPFRMLQTVLDSRQEAKQQRDDTEARRVWDMMQILQAGTRVKLQGLGRVGGVKFDGKLATVQAAFGQRFAVRLDAVDPDGNVREGQGREIKVAAQNMEIWDEAFEQQLAEEEALLKKQQQEERKQIVKDMFKFSFGRSEKHPDDVLQRNEAENPDPAKAVLEFEDLTSQNSAEDLRDFHSRKRLKVKIGKRETKEELYDKICKDWEVRQEAHQIYDRLLRDAQSALRVGTNKPTVRNELRQFVVNPAFKIAMSAITEARQQLNEPFAFQIHTGTVVAADGASATFDARPIDKGGASQEDDVYRCNTLRITKGQGCGQEANITAYHGAERTAAIIPWRPAPTDASSRYEILGSDLKMMHTKGRARDGGRDFIIFAEDADPGNNFYSGMVVRITHGPGKSQVGRIQGYRGESKVATVEYWRYDKDWIEKALDQDDDNLPLVMPTSRSKYKVLYQAVNGKLMPLHLQGRSAGGGEKQLVLQKDAPEIDLFTGKGIRITAGMGMGQTGHVASYDGARREIKVEQWITCIPDDQSRFQILATPQDADLLRTQLKVMEQEEEARKAVVELERKRRMMMRVKMKAAARLKEQAAAWAYYEQAGPQAGAKDNIVYVGGRPRKVTWRSLVLDSEQAMEELIMEELDPDTRQVFEFTETHPREGVMSWNGYNIQWPLYGALQRRDDGSVVQPVRVVEADSGQVLFTGEANDWQVWKSLMEDGTEIEGRDDAFAWRGLTVLQPLTTTGEDGDDIFTVVEYETGRLLYCGPDLVPEEEDAHAGRKAQIVAPDAQAGAALAAVEEAARKKREESRGRVAAARQGAAETSGESDEDQGGRGSGEEQEEEQEKGNVAAEGDAVPETWTPHSAGGQEWKGQADPALWAALLKESVEVKELPGIFRWRGTNLRQPVRDGVTQRVETEEGEVVFHGVNPNEASDFPSEEEQKETIRTRRLAKMKIAAATMETDFGSYTGGMATGKRQGDGAFTWNNGQVYSGQWFDDLQEGTGTEVFPPYDNAEVDKDGEPTFSYYEGQYRDGQRHGKGVYVSVNGDKYHGEFKYGLPDGHGTMVWASGDYVSGNWKGGTPSSKEVKSVKFKEGRVKKEKVQETKTDFEDDNEGGYAFEERAI